MHLPGLPGISGMVKVATNHFLVVHDTKGPVGARLGVIGIQPDGPGYQEVVIPNWPSSEPLPNDLEGICAIPNRPGEYLIVESGFYLGHFGRVIKIGYGEETPLSAKYLGSFRPFSAPQNNASTPKPEQIEGIAVVAHKRGMTVLVLALRGGKNKPDDPDNTVVPGRLIWGTLTDIDTPSPKFTKSKKTAPLSWKAIADRGAADLYVLPNPPNSWDVYSVATSDPGELGPFRSAVYLAGTLKISRKISFAPTKTKKIVHWDIDGLKVEAIAAPAELIKNTGGLSVATDDEFYNGIWRPISKSTETRFPSQLLFIKNAKVGFALK